VLLFCIAVKEIVVLILVGFCCFKIGCRKRNEVEMSVVLFVEWDIRAFVAAQREKDKQVTPQLLRVVLKI